jgi:hypothetical protein
MCTVADALPDVIEWAIVSAFAIGIAYPSVADVFWKPNPDDAAVSMPTTWPLLLTSGPPESPG